MYILKRNCDFDFENEILLIDIPDLQIINYRISFKDGEIKILPTICSISHEDDDGDGDGGWRKRRWRMAATMKVLGFDCSLQSSDGGQRLEGERDN